MTLPVCLVRQGDAFSLDYVRLLRGQIGAQTGIFCLTDRPCPVDGVTAIPLTEDLPGWWAKMEVFSPINGALRPFLFLDLDTFVLGDISPVLADNGDRLLMLEDFYNPGRPASGAMIVPRDGGAVWQRWLVNPAAIMASHKSSGDQGFIGSFCQGYLQAEYPGAFSSYKVHSRDKPTSPIVCFHGFPKPHEADGWAGDIWLNRPT